MNMLFSRPLSGVLCLALGLFLVHSASALAAGETPPGFLPVPSERGLNWEQANEKCKAAGGLLPTAAQLQDIASGGPDSLQPYGWGSGTYWTRESSLGKYYAVPMDTGKMELFTKERLNSAVCAYGSGAPRKSAKPRENFPLGVAPTTMHFEDAVRWCAGKGKQLPTADALKAVAGGTGDASYKQDEWPQGMFWTREAGDGGHRLVHLGNGKDAVFPDTDKSWVTCTE